MRRSDGFTLIELLVVISIIALLLAILIPALNKGRDSAMATACGANLKEYTYAVQMYLQDADDRFPDPSVSYFSTTDRFPVESAIPSAQVYSIGGPVGYLQVRWCNQDVCLRGHPEYGGTLYPYMADARAFICPAFQRLTLHGSEDPTYLTVGSSIKDYRPWYNYTMNAYLGRTDTQMGSLLKSARVEKAAQVKRPGQTFSFTEESPFVDPEYNMGGLDDTCMIAGSPSMVQGWLSRVRSDRWQVVPGPEGVGPFLNVIAGYHHAPSGDRFRGRGNCAFLDGHVAAHSRSETFPLMWPQ
jgi:prepilin-type N-terminal cleavage/methylation domain-containing protein/prepilin-type processing-associated H-X9-DG protein